MDNIELPSPDEGPDCKTHFPSSEVKSNDVTMDNIELPSPGKGPKCQNQPDSRWAEAFTKLNEGDGQRQINGLLFSKQCKIATGSNGAQVFVGKISDQYVAVKRINTDFVQSELEFFDAVKDLQMSHVLKYICYRQDDDFTYFASQLCEYNLKELIEDKSCPFRDRLVPTFYRRVELCIQFLTGLKELHSADILHRDIKPENVLIGQDGTLMLADFGVSRQTYGRATIVTNAPVGSLCWIAKECMENTGCIKYRKSSDIQVAGWLLYYILSDGHIPHEESVPYFVSPMGAIENIRKDHYSVVLPEGSEYLGKTIKDMIRGEGDKRPLVVDCLQYFQDYLAGCTMTSCLNVIGLLPEQVEVIDLCTSDVILDNDGQVGVEVFGDLSKYCVWNSTNNVWTCDVCDKKFKPFEGHELIQHIQQHFSDHTNVSSKKERVSASEGTCGLTLKIMYLKKNVKIPQKTRQQNRKMLFPYSLVWKVYAVRCMIKMETWMRKLFMHCLIQMLVII
ncbi:uncharacterized protein [Ptychodera flava]|uniref:uncharacterized protein isoform X2 n=1 Tax=Ptychodera flava TaxID=63121 RepID=UPI00396A5C7A